MPYTVGPFSASHIYVQWGGKLPGLEQWSCGLRMINKGPGDPVAQAASLMAAISGAVQALHVDATLNICAPAKLSFVKVNAIDTAGHYIAGTTNVTPLADVSGGGSATQVYPNQVALAISLTTGFSRGVAHRGRFYLPLPGYPLEAGGTIQASRAQDASAAVDTFIASLNTIGGAGWEVGIMSRKAGAPGARRVTGNEVGRVLDTQRRRRRSLVENYQ